MADGVRISPSRVDLGAFAWGSARGAEQTVTITNASGAAATVRLDAAGALPARAGRVTLRLADAAGPGESAELPRALDNLAALAPRDRPAPLALPNLPPDASVRVALALEPAPRPPRAPPARLAHAHPLAQPPPAPPDPAADPLAVAGLDEYSLTEFDGVVRVHFAPVDAHAAGAAEEREETALPVCARGCASAVAPNVEHLQFYRCVHGRRYVKDFVVTNLSAIPTLFHLSLSDPTLGSVLTFSDRDTGARLERQHIPLDANASVNVRLAFETGSEGNIFDGTSNECWFAIENMLNPQNVSYVKVASFFSSGNVTEWLEFSCDDSISFGNCYTGNPVYRTIEVRNKLSEPLSVLARSTLPEEVTFGLVIPGLSGKGEDLETEEERMRLLSCEGAEDREKSRSSTPSTQDKSKSFSAARRSGLRRGPKIQFEPGQSCKLRVWYTPEPTPGGNDPGVLAHRSFQLLFMHSSSENRVITVDADVCESIVTLGTTELNLGDCDVLSTVQSSITLFNLSDLPAQVRVKCESKCVTLAKSAVYVEPRQSYDLGLAFLPRVLNPDYVKEITFVNKSNPRCENLIVTLRATNVDRKCISLHSVFYKVLDPGLTNAVRFGRCSANYPAIRAFRIQNVSSERLVLGLDRTPGVVAFVPRWNVSGRRRRGRGPSAFGTFSRDEFNLIQSQAPLTESGRAKARLQEDFVNRRISGTVLSRTLLALLDPEIWEKFRESVLREERREEDPPQELLPLAHYGAHEPRTLSSFLQRIPVFCGANWKPKSSAGASGLTRPERAELQKQWADDMFPPLALETNALTAMEDEMRWADEQLRPGRCLVDAIEKELFVRSNRVSLAPEEETVVCLAVISDDQAVRRRASEKSLRIRLLEYDVYRLQERVKASAWRGAMFSQISSNSDPPPRELVLSVQVCKSPVCLRPLQILNFGTMTAGSRRYKHFIIDNTGSNACLVFKIRKSGSVASGDVKLENGFDSGRLGVVRPYSYATIPFQFRPSLPGPFREEIVVSNEMDSSTSQTLTVKADVLKRSTFHIVPQSRTNFGVVPHNAESDHALLLDVHNDTEKVREFTVAVIDRRRTSSGFPVPRVLISVRESYAESLPAKGAKAVDSSAQQELDAKRSKLEHYLKKGKAAKAEALRREILELEKLLPESDDEDGADEHAGRRVSVNKSTFSVAENSFATVEVALAVPWASTPDAARHHPEMSPRVNSINSFRDAVTVPGINERLDPVSGVSLAGQFLFSLGVFETKNRDRCLSLNCSALIASPPAPPRSGILGLLFGNGGANGSQEPLSPLELGRPGTSPLPMPPRREPDRSA